MVLQIACLHAEVQGGIVSVHVVESQCSLLQGLQISRPISNIITQSLTTYNPCHLNFSEHSGLAFPT